MVDLLLSNFFIQVPLNSLLKPKRDLFRRCIELPSPSSGSGKACETLFCPSLEELLRPLTARGAGKAYDLEHEEALGDSFLKVAVSLRLFFAHDDILDEGRLTRERSK